MALLGAAGGRGPKLTDGDWADVARRLLDGAGIATLGDEGGPRWIAVRHADDHIHIAAVLVREDTGRRLWPRNDYRRLRRTARELETELGLTATAAADRTAARGPQRAELEIASRQGVEPARVELARAVRAAAVGATTPEGFADELRRLGYLVELRRLPSGDPIGYKIARLVDGDVAPRFFSGGKLAPDLSLPKLIARWAGHDPADDTETTSRTTPTTTLRRTRRALEKAEKVVRQASHGEAVENPDGIAHAVGDVFAALSVASGGATNVAAERYDRAARAPFQPAPPVGPVGRELRSVARQLLRVGRLTGHDADGLATTAVILALAALVAEIAARRASQRQTHQAAAARDAAALTRGCHAALPTGAPARPDRSLDTRRSGQAALTWRPVNGRLQHRDPSPTR